VELSLHSPNTPSRRGAEINTGTTLTFTVMVIIIIIIIIVIIIIQYCSHCIIHGNS